MCYDDGSLLRGGNTLKKRKRKRSLFQRDLPVVLAFFLVIVLIVGVAWLAGAAHERNKHAEFLRMFNLPPI